MTAINNNQYDMFYGTLNSLPAMANFSRRVERMEDRHNHPMYLLDKYDNSQLYRFHMCGTHQDIYTIEINRLTGEVNCSCPDNIHYRNAQGTICKHLCFILFKVLKVLNYISHDRWNVYTFNQDTIDFVNKNGLVLTQSQLAICNTNFGSIDLTNSTISKDDMRTVFESIKRKGKSINKVDDKDELNDFIISKNLEEVDECPICFADIEINEEEELMACPSCSKALHKKCMEEWVHRGKDYCIYCGGSLSKLTTVINHRSKKEDIIFKNIETFDIDKLCNKDLIMKETPTNTETVNEDELIDKDEMVEQETVNEDELIDEDEMVEQETVNEDELIDEDEEDVIDEDETIMENEIVINDNVWLTHNKSTELNIGEKFRNYFTEKIRNFFHYFSTEAEIEEVD